MQIIIVHPRLRQARTLMLSPAWLAAGALGLLLAVAAGTGVLSYVTITHAFEARLPFVREWVASAAAQDLETRDQFVRQNIDALAVRVGELQAQLTRLDAIGERVAGMAGINPSELPRSLPGRGGPEPPGSRPLSMQELSAAIDLVSQGLERRGDTLGVIESELVLRSVMSRLLPTSQPLEAGMAGSQFGWRIDPISGRSALHEGIDFNAPAGTPIVAAGAGVVVFAGWHSTYGQQLDIDHGKGLVTRYAHASRLLVKEGDIVKQGQRIAEVGNSGRSTGSHLHFEVRVRDEPRDPLTYLRNGLAGSPAGPLAGVQEPRAAGR